MLIWIVLLRMFLAGGPDAAYMASWEKWKTGVEEDLRNNWVPLAGLFWLKPGANSFGSARGSDLVLPEGTAPEMAGTFDLNGSQVVVQAAAGATISIGGKPVTRAILAPDTEGHPTTVELGNLRMHVIVRGSRVGIRAKDLQSPSLRTFQPLVFFPPDLRYRVTAKWVPSDGRTTVGVPNVLGDVTEIPVPGEVKFRLGGRECSLMALGGSAEKGLFIVFSDATSHGQTYPSGRFLDTGPVANGTVVVDFNRAYNPPCSVTPYATCPLPPHANRLPVAIRAGQRFSGH
jgi:uncharacterized protein